MFNPISVDCLVEGHHFEVIPNPFSINCDLKFSIEKSSNLNIQILNQQGQIIQQMDKQFEKGVHTLVDFMEPSISSGIYFVTLIDEVNHIHQTLKVIKK